MKTLATIVLSLIAIVASLVLIASSYCAYMGGQTVYIGWAMGALAVVVATMWAIGKLNRKPDSE